MGNWVGDEKKQVETKHDPCLFNSHETVKGATLKDKEFKAELLMV